MDPQTLPAASQELYQKIKQQYRVGFESLKLNDDLQLHLLKIIDLEQLLDGKDPLKNPSEFPFWIRLWEAAIVLSRFMVNLRPAPGTTVLELGAGLGAPGLTAAALGCAVTLTDYEEIILDFEKVSTAASKLDQVRFSLLDWLNPPEMERYDIILGAEVLFRDEFFQPLLSVLRRALKPNGAIYLAHDIKRKSVPPFLQLAEKEYAISASKRVLRSLEQDKEILLTRLTPR
ncbi:MAG: methyltransferase domain-containing protein [Candidatus Electrothrix aestuarii]|uniref:Methyltransferase domain-containing protein n=1 Tax=Candidatus Electrothrix aestuarii TaxID=3062594 RepID=A0AAU8LXL6_9BACT|nr:methyltransferase domain-containing protein [Candidatus Electrothrix aestuarii]